MRLAFDGEVRVVGLVGNPRPRSRTYRAVGALAEAAARASGGQVDALIDLIELKDGLFEFGAPSVAQTLERVRAADLLVVGSPVYKASYTGLLKAFLDHLGADELAGKLALPLMVGGAPDHRLALDTHLRPLLVLLGLTCATPGLYLLESQIEAVEALTEEYVGRLGLAPAE